MTIEQALSNLNVQVEMARDEAEQANQALQEVRNRLENLERFQNETQIIGDGIKVINSEAYGNSCVVLTNHYRIDGYIVLVTVTEVCISNRDVVYIGQIVDYTEKTILFACQFYCNDFEDKQELFDRLLINYVEWRFDL